MAKFITRTLGYYDVRCVILTEKPNAASDDEKYLIGEETVKVWSTDPKDEKVFFKDVVDAVEMEFKGGTVVKIVDCSETENVVTVKMPLSMFTFFGEIEEPSKEKMEE